MSGTDEKIRVVIVDDEELGRVQGAVRGLVFRKHSIRFIAALRDRRLAVLAARDANRPF